MADALSKIPYFITGKNTSRRQDGGGIGQSSFITVMHKTREESRVGQEKLGGIVFQRLTTPTVGEEQEVGGNSQIGDTA